MDDPKQSDKEFFRYGPGPFVPGELDAIKRQLGDKPSLKPKPSPTPMPNVPGPMKKQKIMADLLRDENSV